MKVSRRGASADFGESSIELSSPSFSWNAAALQITIKQQCVKDFSTESRHNYKAYLSLNEIQDLLQAISDAAISDPITFEEGLESSIKPLLLILAVVGGLFDKIR